MFYCSILERQPTYNKYPVICCAFLGVIKLIMQSKMARTKGLKELNLQYQFICNEWVQKFCNKQQIEFDGWVGDEIGGIASFACQYFFNLSDIILDLNTKQPKGNILNWQSEDVDFNMFNEKQQHINYKSYTMGLRHEQLKDLSSE